MNGKPLQRRFVYGVLGLLVGTLNMCVTPAARAQFSANFQTNIISGATSNWVGNGTYVVGSNTFLDALQILSGGVLSNGTSYIGYEINGSNNVASVTDVGSVWSNVNNFYVGYNGVGNQLVITNGGSMACGLNFPHSGYLGFNISSSNNTVLVSGAGSVWRLGSGFNMGDVYVGENGAKNRVVITNGGAAFCGRIYLGDFISSSNNSVLVAGSGSIWSNNGELYLGYRGAGNSFVISNAGKVFSGFYGRIGELNSNNVMIVTGSNSVWNIGSPFAADLYLGYSSSANSLIISNGGAVYDGTVWLGNSGLSASNSVVVTGSGSVWSNSGMYVGFGGIGNSLTIANGAAVFNANSATVGNNGSGSFVFVSGSGSVWSNGASLMVGSSTAENTVTITAGAKVISNGGTVGGSSSAGHNAMAIIGSGSVWSNSGDLALANGGSINQFILFNGGSAYNGNAYLGFGGSSSVASTFGGNSLWYNRGSLYVGYTATTCHLQVGSSSTVIASNAYVGYNGGTFNLVDVMGGNFYVTNAAHNAVLDVRCGQLNVSSGLLQVDILICTNACGHISHTGGTLIVGSLVLDPNLDADNDGLPNGWEQAHGLDPLSGGGNDGTNGDPDGDGFSNLQEYLAGTDPTNSASSFRITSAMKTGGDVLVTWTMGSGKTNALQWTAGAGDGSYATNSFTNLFIVTNTVGTVTNYLDVGGAANSPARYYRVRLVP